VQNLQILFVLEYIKERFIWIGSYYCFIFIKYDIYHNFIMKWFWIILRQEASISITIRRGSFSFQK